MKLKNIMKYENIIKYESSYKSIKKTSMIKVIIKFENVCKANAKEAEEILFLRWMLNGAFARLLCCHLLVSGYQEKTDCCRLYSTTDGNCQLFQRILWISELIIGRKYALATI